MNAVIYVDVYVNTGVNVSQCIVPTVTQYWVTWQTNRELYIRRTGHAVLCSLFLVRQIKLRIQALDIYWAVHSVPGSCTAFGSQTNYFLLLENV